MPWCRRSLAGVVLFVFLTFAAPASAEIASIFGGDVECEVRADGFRFCGSTGSELTTTATFDGVPIDVNVAFPPEPAGGPDGGYPLIMMFDGYGNPKRGLDAMQVWLDRGYAAFGMTMRGFRGSCGSLAARDASPERCADGYLRLMDTRYEVHDAQYLAGRLVDEGLVAPQRIGATGGSYGGVISTSLAMLRDRVMRRDGELVAWTSPGGTPMEIAGATPSVPWSDLSSVLLANGSALDYVSDASYVGRPGVERFSLVETLHLGCIVGYCAPRGSDPAADLRTWRDRLSEGEPYDGDPAVLAMIAELSAFHSPYGIEPSRPPAPILISSGFTDDVVPVEEALRLYGRTKTLFPDALFSLFLGDFGHDRAQAPAQADAVGGGLKVAWLDHHVGNGSGPSPFDGVTALTQTCPSSLVQPRLLEASDWASLAPGEVRMLDGATRTILPDGGDAAITTAFSPLTEGAACNRASGADQLGTASFRFPPAPAGGYTLIGSPTIEATFTTTSPGAQVAARLVDVAPDGQATLVSRGIWRPRSSLAGARQVFQLQANGWVFESGHVAKLELVPEDAPFWRPSNDQGTVTVSAADIRLPVRERPGTRGGFVTEPRPKTVSSGLLAGAPVPPGDQGPEAGQRLGAGHQRARRHRVRLRLRAGVSAGNQRDPVRHREPELQVHRLVGALRRHGDVHAQRKRGRRRGGSLRPHLDPDARHLGLGLGSAGRRRRLHSRMRAEVRRRRQRLAERDGGAGVELLRVVGRRL